MERTCYSCARWKGLMPCQITGRCEVDGESKLAGHEACADDNFLPKDEENIPSTVTGPIAYQ